jgi:cold shock protein
MPTEFMQCFNGTKGFGFIAPDGSDPDCFAHIQAAGFRTLTENQSLICGDLRRTCDERGAVQEIRAEKPGSITVAWIPSGASSIVRASVSPSTANLVEQ